MIKLAPSILSANFARLGEQVQEADSAGADYIHADVMDGHFVPNLTIGPVVVAAIRPMTKLPLDVHLMIESPERYIGEFANAGADILTVHQETCVHLHRIVELIKGFNKKAGVSINPATPINTLEEILPYIDLVLIMSVNPGFGGQAFIETTLHKIAKLRKMIVERGLESQIEIEVDGGIKAETAPRIVAAGAQVIVAGSAIFNKQTSVAEAIQQLRMSIAQKKPATR
jgi:ribulose-phosphate 3-epimerase